jgi:2,4-dienoyl-CoA reductase-like NADH-dependent reductase (Old Yellow Enzyme family)/thioredoxin reductase
MGALDILLEPFAVAGVDFRNRIVSTAHAPGYAEGGLPLDRYQRYHEEKAKGGVALTMVGGSSIVTPEIASIYGQIDIGRDATVPHLSRLAQRVHAHGARIMLQISHMGRRTAWDDGDWIAPVAPSAVRDPAHHAVPRAMEIEDIERVIAAYGAAARRCAEAGLDGVEVLVAAHLPGQFLSPEANRRDDEWGGPLDNRMRFLDRVLRAVRAETAPGFLVSLRMAADESSEGGADGADCLAVAHRLRAAGLYDLLNVNGIAASTTPGLAKLIAGMAAPLAPWLDAARAFRAAVGAPTIHAGRIADLSTAAHAVASGATDLVGMTRAHFADPHLVAKLRDGAPERIRPCVGAAYCIDRIYAGRAAYCLHNPATGRERTLPQAVAPSPGPKRRVLVVGGGPAGMEAARVARLRGHAVTLLEAAPRLGGQILLAAKAGWRRDLIGVADWLAAEIERLGVDIRLNAYAEAAEVAAEAPDIVVLATGGAPKAPDMPGGDLALSGWEALERPAAVGERVLLYDEAGGHAAMALADHLSAAGRRVELVAPDRAVGRGLGGSSYPVYLGALKRRGAVLTPDTRLAAIARSGNRLVATLVHDYAGTAETREVDTVIAELGTAPDPALFAALKPLSANRGVVDPAALQAGAPQLWLAAPAPGMLLFRIGDAAASRDIHAALLDALRIAKDF